MNAACTQVAQLEMLDRVSVDGRRGTVAGFYAREERTVLIQLDAGGSIEVAESRVEAPAGRERLVA